MSKASPVKMIKMNGNTALLLILTLLTVSCLTLPSLIRDILNSDNSNVQILTANLAANSTLGTTISPKPNATETTQPASQSQFQQSQSSMFSSSESLPSPFEIAAIIVSIVAVSGAVLSLILNRRLKKI